MTAAGRLAALDATDPMRSFDDCARLAGVEPPILEPGDHAIDLLYDLVLYWPDVPPELQEERP